MDRSLGISVSLWQSYSSWGSQFSCIAPRCCVQRDKIATVQEPSEIVHWPLQAKMSLKDFRLFFGAKSNIIRSSGLLFWAASNNKNWVKLNPSNQDQYFQLYYSVKSGCSRKEEENGLSFCIYTTKEVSSTIYKSLIGILISQKASTICSLAKKPCLVKKLTKISLRLHPT